MRRSLMIAQPIIIVVLLVALTTRAQSPEAPTLSDRNAAHRLLSTMNAMELSSQALDGMFKAYAQQLPQVDSKVWVNLRSEFDTSELAPVMEEIYMRYFTQDELNGLADFFEGPLGSLYIEMQPSLLHESMAAGQAWSEGINARMRSRLEKKKLTNKL